MMEKHVGDTKALPGHNEELKLSSLERLPAEIRNRIYAMVTIYDQIILDPRGLDATMSVSQPALAATNSNIREEVLPIFYGANKFLIEIGDGDPDLGYPYVYDADYDNDYTPFIKSIPHVQLMKRIGAYDPVRFHGGKAKLQACINDDGKVEIIFEGFEVSWPACLCWIMREMRDEGDVNRSTTLAARLMLACARDLNKTMELVRWRVVSSEGPVFRTPPVSGMRGCKRCREFRKSVRYHRR